MTAAPHRLVPADATEEEMTEHFRSLESVGLVGRMGVELVTAERGRVSARMPVDGNTQPMGLLHGGASAALAETVGSWAAAIAAPDGHAPVGTELSATHHRSARAGWVTGTAIAIHEGRRTATYGIEVRDEDGRLLCTSRLTCMFVPFG